MTDVRHPAHYCQGEIECWDAARTFLGDEGFIAACRFNINKYNWRAADKKSMKEDIQKVIVYASKILEVLEESDDHRTTKN